MKNKTAAKIHNNIDPAPYFAAALLTPIPAFASRR